MSGIIQSLLASLAAEDSYKLYSWGYNYRGNLGLGNVTRTFNSPVQVGSLTNWSQAGVGPTHTILIKKNNTIWSVGFNSRGQLGIGNTYSRSSPVQIGSLTNWAQAAACGTSFGNSLAVKTDNTLWAWGYNGLGQLGKNNRTNFDSPVQVGALTDWALITAGQYSSIAVKTNNTLWAWGDNSDGQLGLSDRTNRSNPVQVGALTDWATVFAGDRHTIAVKTNGTLWTWGSGNYGQLGSNNITSRSSPAQVGALTTWRSAKVSRFSSIATRTNNTLWTWGDNSAGTLGRNDRVNRSSPVQVTGTDWSAKIGSTDNGFAAIRTAGTLWTWGSNNMAGSDGGQLGLGDKVNRSSPTQVGALATWDFVSYSGNQASWSMFAITKN